MTKRKLPRHISELIYDCMKRLKLNKSQFCETSKIDKTTLYCIANGHKRISLETASRLEKILEIKAELLLEKQDEYKDYYGSLMPPDAFSGLNWNDSDEKFHRAMGRYLQNNELPNQDMPKRTDSDYITFIMEPDTTVHAVEKDLVKN